MPDYKGMFVTDLDGTLSDSTGKIPSRVVERLHLLGELGVLRVVATGRNLFSAGRVLSGDFPADFLIFSCGAGIQDRKTGVFSRTESLDRAGIEAVLKVVLPLKLDFMIHKEIPDNHHFTYFHASGKNQDFLSRVALYEKVSRESSPPFSEVNRATQFVVIVPEENGAATFERLRKELPSHSVIRTTSPLDRKSVWIEIYPCSASKGLAAEYLRAQLGIPSDRTAAVGNDFNDEDLLAWAHRSFWVEGTPEELKTRHEIVASPDDGGLLEAIERWTKG